MGYLFTVHLKSLANFSKQKSYGGNLQPYVNFALVLLETLKKGGLKEMIVIVRVSDGNDTIYIVLIPKNLFDS